MTKGNMTKRKWTRHLWLAFGGLCVSMLAAAIFTLGSLNAPVRPESGNDFVILFALSTFIVIAFLVFGLILTRSVLRLWAEYRAGLLGSRFKTKWSSERWAFPFCPSFSCFSSVTRSSIAPWPSGSPGRSKLPISRATN